MWTRTDIFNETFITAWTARTVAQKTFDLARAYFEAKVKAIADFNANAATELKDAVASTLAEFANQRRNQQRKCDGRGRGKRG